MKMFIYCDLRLNKIIKPTNCWPTPTESIVLLTKGHQHCILFLWDSVCVLSYRGQGVKYLSKNLPEPQNIKLFYVVSIVLTDFANIQILLQKVKLVYVALQVV